MSEQQYSPLSLLNIDGGSVPEVFDAELQKVLANIADPNTNPKAKRQIVLKVTVAADDGLEQLGYVVECQSKLAPVKASARAAHLVRHQGVLHAMTENVRQDDLMAALETATAADARGAGVTPLNRAAI